MAQSFDSSPNSSDLANSSAESQAKVITFSHKVSVKLDQSNFLLWRQQIEAAIRGHRLQKFVFERNPPFPMKFLNSTDESSGNYNPAYLDWDAQDNLLVSWLLSSISAPILTKMVGCRTSSQIWTTLETYFASKTRAKTSQLRDQLKETKKGSLSLSDYLLKIKHTVDQLASVGTLLFESEHIDAIFEGLTADYDSFVVSIHSRKDEYIVEEVESLLLAHEMRLEKRVKESGQLSVNLVNTHGSSQEKKSVNPFSQSSAHQTSNYSGKGSNRNKGSSNNFRGKNAWQTNNKPQCQLCGKIGHLSGKCYGRFDPNFQGLGVQFSSSGTSQGYTGNTQGYFGNYSHPNPFATHQMQAQLASYMATPNSVNDEHWFPDSGATNHVTADANNLAHKSEYQGFQGNLNARDS